ncbi:hypothetical protein L1987_45746 [Smallanthus sonchifolius]|uniref:Uncharacterized protein n=1 Tax=Smallanthus sonchifolius TaxID=185202 RepID=A0ACB9FYF4_9ASTR|nr:hypothetical protein L1987_45746 [Smallanthus sonchifolius]
MKVHKYLRKGYHAILANLTEKNAEVRKIKDISIVREYPEVFPEDLPRIPPARRVEFLIDLTPGAAPMARSPYPLTPSEMQELAKSASGGQSDIRAPKESTHRVKIKQELKLGVARSCIPLHGRANGDTWPCTLMLCKIPSRARNECFVRLCIPLHSRALSKSLPINRKLILEF